MGQIGPLMNSLLGVGQFGASCVHTSVCCVVNLRRARSVTLYTELSGVTGSERPTGLFTCLEHNHADLHRVPDVQSHGEIASLG